MLIEFSDFCLRFCVRYFLQVHWYVFLSAFQLLKEDIAKHRAILQQAENVGQKLIDSSHQDPVVVADIHGQLNKIRAVLDKMAAKMDQRQDRLQNVLLQSQEFQVSFEDFLEKLAKVEEQIARQEPVSAVYDTVKDQSREQKVLYHKIPKIRAGAYFWLKGFLLYFSWRGLIFGRGEGGGGL